MDKNTIIAHYSESNEEKGILSHILDLAERSRQRSTVESGSFLSEALKMRADAMLSHVGYSDYFFFGGYDGAERTCAVFLTDYCGVEEIAESPSLAEVVFIKAELDRYNRAAEISHRDVLGSLMGLGIERDAVGDIVVENGTAIFCVKESIAPFIKESLCKISRYPVSATVYQKLEIHRSETAEECFDTVASLRLDAVTASLFSTSRSISAEAITAGLVAVNGVTAKKTDMTVSEGDKISYRGHGKAELEKIDGLSKKGRTRILFKKWK